MYLFCHYFPPACIIDFHTVVVVVVVLICLKTNTSEINEASWKSLFPPLKNVN